MCRYTIPFQLFPIPKHCIPQLSTLRRARPTLEHASLCPLSPSANYHPLHFHLSAFSRRYLPPKRKWTRPSSSLSPSRRVPQPAINIFLLSSPMPNLKLKLTHEHFTLLHPIDPSHRIVLFSIHPLLASIVYYRNNTLNISSHKQNNTYHTTSSSPTHPPTKQQHLRPYSTPPPLYTHGRNETKQNHTTQPE